MKAQQCGCLERACHVSPFTSPSLLLSIPSTLVPPPCPASLVFIAAVVCVCVCVCICVHGSIYVCVHAQEMETLKVGPMTSDPLLVPQQKPSRKADSAAHKKGEKRKERSGEWRKSREEGRPSCKQHNANESLAEAQSCSERVPRTNPPPRTPPTFPDKLKAFGAVKHGGEVGGTRGKMG